MEGWRNTECGCIRGSSAQEVSPERSRMPTWMQTTHAAEEVPYEDHQVALRAGIAINVAELEGFAVCTLNREFADFLKV